MASLYRNRQSQVPTADLLFGNHCESISVVEVCVSPGAVVVVSQDVQQQTMADLLR